MALLWRKTIFHEKSGESKKIPKFLQDIPNLRYEFTEKLLQWRYFIISFTELFQNLFIPDILLSNQTWYFFTFLHSVTLISHTYHSFFHKSLQKMLHINLFTNFPHFIHNFWSVSICSKSIYFDEFWLLDFFWYFAII